ncbi:integrase [Desulfobacula toluolica Tol2]|uniref:Integrase n=1 Tax=Desulfobacula toluolica (strain DSM 7467 / Tol2) TaxID=651182 RepID=K0NGY5_DESTT|nr:integrase [Desulfobacula toluolica Tol2]
MSIEEKKQRIQSKHSKISIQRQCELIGLPRSSYYRESRGEQETPENLELMKLIDIEYTDHPFYGTRQMRNIMRRKGYKINRKRVQRLMRKMGIQSIAPKPNTSKAHPQNKVYPYLLRTFDVTRSNQVWSTDITYIPLSGGFVYLTAVMDWHSRYVLSWELSITMDKEFCISSLEMALRCHGTPYIFNTDQGSQYTSHEFTKVLKYKDIKISMDGKGRCMDNIFIERLWRSVKYEEIYVNEFQSVEQLRKSLKKYFNFYNHERPHQSFNGQTPAEIYYGKNQLRLVG